MNKNENDCPRCALGDSSALSERAMDAVRLVSVVAESGVVITCRDLREKILRPYFGEETHAELERFFAGRWREPNGSHEPRGGKTHE